MSIIKRLKTSKFGFWLTYRLSALINFIILFVLKRKADVTPAYSLVEAEYRLTGLQWSEDVINIVGIPISHPFMYDARYVQYKLNRGEKPQTDCDEFALYALSMIKALPILNDSFILTVRGVKRSGGFVGHNVCCFSYVDAVSGKVRYGHLGNWGLITGFASLKHAARAIALIMSSTMLAYATADDRLRLITYEDCR